VNLDTVRQGLSIAVVGMGLVFVALALIVAAIRLMGRYLRLPAPSEHKASAAADEEMERSRIAAMAAAIMASGEGADESTAGAWASDAWSGPASPWLLSHRTWVLRRQPDHTDERGKRL
jgi:sodium pump decarboxylase gamma subunit